MLNEKTVLQLFRHRLPQELAYFQGFSEGNHFELFPPYALWFVLNRLRGVGGPFAKQCFDVYEYGQCTSFKI